MDFVAYVSNILPIPDREGKGTGKGAGDYILQAQLQIAIAWCSLVIALMSFPKRKHATHFFRIARERRRERSALRETEGTQIYMIFTGDDATSFQPKVKYLYFPPFS